MMFSSVPRVVGVERVADPRRDRVVRATGVLVELPLRGADEQDRRALEQRQRLDEVGLPEVGAEEAAPAALAARVVLLAVDDQEDDADGAEQADELAEPLVGVPVADERPGEGRLEELEVRRQHGRAEEQERRVDEPVHDADPGPLQHPGVEEALLEHRHGPADRVARAVEGRLSTPDDADHAAYGRHQQSPGRRGSWRKRRRSRRSAWEALLECRAVDLVRDDGPVRRA